MTFEEIQQLVAGTTLPFGSINEDGEYVIIEAGNYCGERFYRVTTIQKNDWIRINYIHEDGRCEELFER